ncbi:kinase-like protein [Earliella scabrosa]|nr:kinase-like protein [Earliella scabrosa]
MTPLSPTSTARVSESRQVRAVTRELPRRKKAMPKILVPASDEGGKSDPVVEHSLSVGKYEFKVGAILLDRYRVVGVLGQGSYGTVAQAEDVMTNTVVAVKVLHKSDVLHADINVEERIYTQLILGCSPSVRLFAEVVSSGEIDGQHCVIFECCQLTLWHLVFGSRRLLPLPMRHLKEMAYQLIQGVAYLHSMGLIHTDIKPNNIGLKSGDAVLTKYMDSTIGFHDTLRLVSTELRVLDLGGVVEELPSGHVGIVGALGYRAPEVSLGLPWGRGVDTFAIGCVIAELYLATSLFPAGMATPREHLALVERLVGPFPVGFASSVESKFPGTFRTDSEVRVVFPGKELNREEHGPPLSRLQSTKPLAAQIHDVSLTDLLKRMMCPDPAKRVNLELALKHRFFDELRVSNGRL